MSRKPDAGSTLNQILFQKGDKLVIKPDAKFEHPENQCYNWSENIVLRYFVEKMDLMGYADCVCSYPIDGPVFLSLHDELPLKELTLKHPMHMLKINQHASRMRDLCYDSLERKEFPKYLEEFESIHIAYHLQKKKVNVFVLKVRFTLLIFFFSRTT
jgi:hypothetical protein